MNKKIIFMVILFFISLCFCFAAGNVDEKGDTGQLAHITVNNDNYYWDISQVTNNLILPTSDFQSHPSDEIGLLRFRANNDKVGTVEITSEGIPWQFVHENNTTMQREFDIEVYKIKHTRDSAEADFIKGTPQKIALNKVGDSYSFSTEIGKWSIGYKWIGIFRLPCEYCSMYYEYEIRLVLNSTTALLEPGDYYANLTVDIPKGANYSERDIVHYRLKGRAGESSLDNSNYSFMVQSTSETYNFDLLNYVNYRSVASASFNAIRYATSYNKTTEEKRFKVYLSPFPHIDDDGASANNPYYFIKYDTENQPRTTLNTVYYEVASDYRGTKWKTLDNAHPHTYVLPILFDAQDAVGTQKQLTWKFEGGDEIGIYIKPESRSGITPSSGLYYTNLYFYVESN